MKLTADMTSVTICDELMHNSYKSQDCNFDTNPADGRHLGISKTVHVHLKSKGDEFINLTKISTGVDFTKSLISS